MGRAQLIGPRGFCYRANLTFTGQRAAGEIPFCYARYAFAYPPETVVALLSVVAAPATAADIELPAVVVSGSVPTRTNQQRQCDGFRRWNVLDSTSEISDRSSAGTLRTFETLRYGWSECWT
jgi:hypothetical protein